MAIEEIFNKAAERVKELPKGSVSNEDQLELYSYFKQANGGDCTTDRPGGLFNMEGKAKWDAYNSRKGMSKEDAMKAYIEKVDGLCGTSFASEC